MYAEVTDKDLVSLLLLIRRMTILEQQPSRQVMHVKGDLSIIILLMDLLGYVRSKAIPIICYYSSSI